MSRHCPCKYCTLGEDQTRRLYITSCHTNTLPTRHHTIFAPPSIERRAGIEFCQASWEAEHPRPQPREPEMFNLYWDELEARVIAEHMESLALGETAAQGADQAAAEEHAEGELKKQDGQAKDQDTEVKDDDKAKKDGKGKEKEIPDAIDEAGGNDNQP